MTREEEWQRIEKLYDEVLDLKSYDAIEHILPTFILEDFQCADLVRSLFFRRFIFSYDTGLGKTLMACAWMKMLKRQDPNRKFLFFVTKAQLSQTPSKVAEATGFKITCSTGESEELEKNIFRKDLDKYDVVMLTHSALNNAGLMLELYKNREKFFGVIVDEAHELSNMQGAKSAFSFLTMMHYFKWGLALTATPMKISPSELVNLMYIMNRDAIYDIKTCEGMLLEGGIDKFRDLIVVRTRKELGIYSNYVPHVHMLEPTHAQFQASGQNMFTITKGEGAYPETNKVIEIINSHKPSRGLMYINQHAIRDFVTSELDKTDIRYACINGKTKTADRTRICDEFNSGKLDLIITSVTSALDLDCDYLIFYEFTVDLKQMIGRAERGLNPKTLDIHYIFVAHTEEPTYFYKNIYLRSLMVKTVLGQDVEHVIKAMKMVASS